MQSIARNTCSLRIQKHKVSLFGERYIHGQLDWIFRQRARARCDDRNLYAITPVQACFTCAITRMSAVSVYMNCSVTSSHAPPSCTAFAKSHDYDHRRPARDRASRRLFWRFYRLLSDHPLHNVIAGTRDNREILT